MKDCLGSWTILKTPSHGLGFRGSHRACSRQQAVRRVPPEVAAPACGARPINRKAAIEERTWVACHGLCDFEDLVTPTCHGKGNTRGSAARRGGPPYPF